MKLTSNNALIASIFIALLVLGTTFFISSFRQKQSSAAAVWVLHTQDVLYHSEELLNTVIDNQTRVRGYIITGNYDYIQKLNESRNNIRNELKVIIKLTADNPRQQLRLDSLQQYTEKRIAWSDSLINTRNTMGLNAAALMVGSGTGKQIIDRIRELVQQVQSIENGLLKERKAELEKAEAAYDTAFRVGLAIIILLAIVVFQKLRTDIIAQQKANALIITERSKIERHLTRSNAQLENVLQTMGDGFVIFDRQYRHIFMNNAIRKLFGEAADYAMGKSVFETSPELQGTLFQTELEMVMRERVPRSFEFYLDYFKIWVYFRVYPIEDGICTFLTDITAQKKAEQEIKALQEDLEQKVVDRTAALNAANREMETFTYSVSHDLRAPLRGILGFTTVLEEEYANKLDNEARRITGIIKKNTLKMGELVDDLLTFSRMARKDLVKSAINNNEVVKEVIDMDSTSQAGNGRPVEWTIHPLPRVMGDAGTIRQVWINLISNAVKYSRKTPQPHIEIGSFPYNNQIAFFVKDNGVGFDAKYKDKLFNVFQRLHSEAEFEGTGVGLAIVEKIISKHGGKVWADAQLNKGAAFYFSLPADMVEMPARKSKQEY